MRKTIAASMCALLLATTGVASAQRVLSMATLAPAGSTFMRVFDAANRELRRRSSGQLTMRWYAGGVQGDESEVMRKIRSGRLDGAAVTAVGLGQVHRPILAFQAPGMFSSSAQLVRARTALASEIDTAFTNAGFILLGFGTTGGPRLMSTQEIRTPAQLRSAHPWQWRDDMILPALFQEAGATGVPLQVPEVLSAIQTGRVDTVVASPLIGVSLQWATNMRYISDSSATSSLGAILLSRQQFESVPADQQAMFREVWGQFGQLLSTNVARDDAAALTSLTGRGMTVMNLNAGERQQWVDLFGRARRRLVGQVADAAWFSRVEAAGR